MADDIHEKRISDAVSLIKLLEHFAGSQSSNDVPWSGIKMTLSNCRDLLEAALADSDLVIVEPRPRPQLRQEAEGRVREIPARSSTFGRVQLPKNGAPNESLDV